MSTAAESGAMTDDKYRKELAAILEGIGMPEHERLLLLLRSGLHWIDGLHGWTTMICGRTGAGHSIKVTDALGVANA